MEQSGALQDIADIGFIIFGKSRIPDRLCYGPADALSQRFAERRDFQRMGQSRPHKVTFIQGKYLCLILQPAERGAADDPVIILLILRAQIRRAFLMIASDAIRTQ